MKKMRSLWNIALVFVISVAMLLGNFSIAAFAGAEEPSAFLANGGIQTEVELDDQFDIPTASDGYTVNVTAPNGQNVVPEGNKVSAEQRGIYVVKVSGGDLAYPYTYNVYCKESGDYTLNVPGDYAIPSYVATNAPITLPQAEFVDEDGNKVENAAVELEVVNSNYGGNVEKLQLSDGKYQYTKTDKAGSLYFTYRVKKSGSENSKLYMSYTKEYEVKVQDGFSDKTAPKLSVSGVPSSAQINNKVTLPAATATDDSDERVEIVINVTAPDGKKIYEAVVDEESGYATSFGNEEVVFDNADNRVFYPQYTGAYTIEYYARDDGGQTSSVYKYFLNVTNNNPATLVNGDELENAIPSKWGFKVKKADQAPQSSEILFPMPDFRHQQSDADITVSFTISNDDDERIIYFENIYNDEKKATDAPRYNEGNKEGIAFTDEGFEFDPNLINEEDRVPGTYTAVYRSRVNSRTRTKTITFDLQDTYYDRNAPSVEDIETVEYLVLKEGNTFTVPTVSYTDKEDAKATLVFNLKNDTETFDISEYQGKELKIAKDKDDANKFVLVYKDTEKEDAREEVVAEIGTAETTEISLEYYAYDKVGNESGRKTHLIRIATSAALQIESIDGIDTDEFDRAEKKTNEITMGGFEIENVEDPMLIGYEISVLDPDGNDVEVRESRLIGEDNTIYVRNITFNSDKEGNYTLFIRIFNTDDQVVLFAFTKTVKNRVPEDSAQGYSLASVVFDTKEDNNVNEKYKLPTANLKDDLLQVITIEGYRHSVIGDTFTPLRTGTIRVYNNFIEKAKLGESYDFAISDLSSGELTRYVYGGVVDPEVPEINVESIVPHIDVSVRGDKGFDPDTHIFKMENNEPVWYVSDEEEAQEYTGEGQWFVLSEVTAFTANGQAGKITVTVTYGTSSVSSTSVADDNIDDINVIRRVYRVVDGENVFYTLNEYEALHGKYDGKSEFANRWAFIATENSVYTIDYSAESTGGAQSNTVSQRLVVGDTVAPTINVTLANETGKGLRIEDANGNNVTGGYKSGNMFFYDFVKENILLDANDTENTVSVKLELLNNGENVYGSKDISSEWITLYNLASRLEKQKGYELGTGSYTVKITIKDEVGNESVRTYEFTVSATQSAMSVPLTVLTWVLSILAVVLIVFVVIYIVRLRKIKK